MENTHELNSVKNFPLSPQISKEKDNPHLSSSFSTSKINLLPEVVTDSLINNNNIIESNINNRNFPNKRDNSPFKRASIEIHNNNLPSSNENISEKNIVNIGMNGEQSISNIKDETSSSNNLMKFPNISKLVTSSSFKSLKEISNNNNLNNIQIQKNNNTDNYFSLSAKDNKDSLSVKNFSRTNYNINYKLLINNNSTTPTSANNNNNDINSNCININNINTHHQRANNRKYSKGLYKNNYDCLIKPADPLLKRTVVPKVNPKFGKMKAYIKLPEFKGEEPFLKFEYKPLLKEMINTPSIDKQYEVNLYVNSPKMINNLIYLKTQLNKEGQITLENFVNVKKLNKSSEEEDLYQNYQNQYYQDKEKENEINDDNLNNSFLINRANPNINNENNDYNNSNGFVIDCSKTKTNNFIHIGDNNNLDLENKNNDLQKNKNLSTVSSNNNNINNINSNKEENKSNSNNNNDLKNGKTDNNNNGDLSNGNNNKNEVNNFIDPIKDIDNSSNNNNTNDKNINKSNNNNQNNIKRNSNNNNIHSKNFLQMTHNHKYNRPKTCIHGLKPYYTLKGKNDKTLIFESRFESGNLLCAFRTEEENCYQLYLQNDTNTTGYIQWFFFRVSNTQKGRKVNFNIINMLRKTCIYSHGLKIMTYSTMQALRENIGWHRDCENLIYYPNNLYIFNENCNKRRNLHSLSFDYEFKYDNDTVYFANCLPYFYSSLMKELNQYELNETKYPYFHKKTLATTLGGNDLDMFTINSLNDIYSNGVTNVILPKSNNGNSSYNTNNNNYYFSKNNSELSLSKSKNLNLKINSNNISSSSNSNSNNNMNSNSSSTTINSNNNNNSLISTTKRSNTNTNVNNTFNNNSSSTIFDNRKAVIIIARQHPGETVGSYVMQGCIDFLMSESPEAKKLREIYLFKIVPMMNPDGVLVGNSRTSFAGCDLNRRWSKPSEIIHPEIFYTKQMITKLSTQRNIAFIIDCHGHFGTFNALFYCNYKENRRTCTLFPYLCGKLSKIISFQQCSFAMPKYKQSTERVSLFNELDDEDNSNIVALETSFFGVNRAGEYARLYYNSKLLKEVGRDVCLGMLSYYYKYENISLNNEPNYKDRENFKKLDVDMREFESEIIKEVNEEDEENNNEGGDKKNDEEDNESESEPSVDNLDKNQIMRLMPNGGKRRRRKGKNNKFKKFDKKKQDKAKDIDIVLYNPIKEAEKKLLEEERRKKMKAKIVINCKKNSIDNNDLLEPGLENKYTQTEEIFFKKHWSYFAGQYKILGVKRNGFVNMGMTGFAIRNNNFNNNNYNNNNFMNGLYGNLNKGKSNINIAKNNNYYYEGNMMVNRNNNMNMNNNMNINGGGPGMNRGKIFGNNKLMVMGKTNNINNNNMSNVNTNNNGDQKGSIAANETNKIQRNLNINKNLHYQTSNKNLKDNTSINVNNNINNKNSNENTIKLNNISPNKNLNFLSKISSKNNINNNIANGGGNDYLNENSSSNKNNNKEKSSFKLLNNQESNNNNNNVQAKVTGSKKPEIKSNVFQNVKIHEANHSHYPKNFNNKKDKNFLQKIYHNNEKNKKKIINGKQNTTEIENNNIESNNVNDKNKDSNNINENEKENYKVYSKKGSKEKDEKNNKNLYQQKVMKKMAKSSNSFYKFQP